MRTRRVTLLLCAVCGLSLQASADDSRYDSPYGGCAAASLWRPLDPQAVFGPDEAPRTAHHAPQWERMPPCEGRTIANCKSQIEHCELRSSLAAPLELAPSSSPFGICNLQCAIPFGHDRVVPSDWLVLVDDDADDDVPRAASSSVTLRDDVRGFLPGAWRDARGIVRTENMLILGGALAAAVGIRQDLDDEVRDETENDPDRWGDVSRYFGHLGEAPVQVPVLGLIWATSLWTHNAELHGFSHTLLSAYTINGLSVLVIKGITDTDRPDPDWNGGRWGFPSFHAASSFTIAGVLEEYYGWKAGLPAYTLAGLISWSRIDERDHDLSDVVFGAAMGWVIGKSVARQHLTGDGRVLLFPWSHPYEPAHGVALEVQF